MKRLRLIAAILVCKILILAGKLLGKQSSSAPGKFALKVCGDALRQLSCQTKYETVCVLGTNGKTTTNNMIDMLISQKGFRTVCNSVGANMFDGVATAFLSSANLFGKLSADYAVLEVDEASAKLVFDQLTPDIIVITNLFRDQMDRYGEIDDTLEQLKIAIDKAPDAVLVLNADDPMCNFFTKAATNRFVTFGISEESTQQLRELHEGRTCKFCGAELEYNFYHYNQLGDYHCPNCDFKRELPHYAATNIVCEPKIRFQLNASQTVAADIYGFYNIYNMLGAITVSELLQLEISDYSEAFVHYTPQTARMEEFPFEKPVILNLAKNPAGFNQAIATLINDRRKKAVVIGINDNPSDGCDISWLYDVNFEQLTNCTAYAVAGKRCYDMALRLFYADVCDSPKINPNPVPLAMELLQTDCEVVYVLVNYTLIFEVKKELSKELKEYQKYQKSKGESQCS